MHRRLINIIRNGILLFIICLAGQLHAQTTTIRGAVTDSKTGDAIPFVNVLFEGTSTGVTTDFNGQYFIETKENSAKLRFSIVGYKTEFRDIKPGESQIVSLKLIPEVMQLKELTVKGEKKRYRNKNNPAVDLIRIVIDHKKENRKEQLNQYEYEKYEKVQFALSNISEKFMKKKYLNKFQFVFDNLDSNQMPGKVILPMYLKETLSDVYYRKDPKDKKEIVSATRDVDYGKYLNDAGLNTFIAYLYQDVNIYDNSVPLLTNFFISPIADNAVLFYKYYIKDTVMVGDQKCFHMVFYPRNKSDFNFQGELYITYDSSYAIRKSELTVSPDINLNWVKELTLTQEYERVKKGEWMLSSDNISIDFGVGKNNLGVYGQRAVSYKNFILDQPKPDSFFSGEKLVVPDSAAILDEKYWENKRHSALTASEKGVYQMADSIQRIPAFKRAMNIMVLLFAGYEDLGLVELGPVSTFYSYNPVEGSRLRFGGRTTEKFSTRIQYETYAAYGFTDQQWKYYIGVTKALGKKSVIDFPQKNLIVSYQYETKIPGQELQFVQEDNVFLSIKRGENNKLLYLRSFKVNYLSEFQNHFSFNIGFEHLTQAPGGQLYFNQVSYNDAQYNIADITTTEMNLVLRFAPNEQFYQGKKYRKPMPNKYPITELRFKASQKDILESDYTYQHAALRIYKLFNIPPIGYTNVIVEVGKIFGRVPYPLLQIHRANQTYSYQLESYNLMNFLEFISDEYAALNVDHYFNGFFFNKIPLLKRLKWREVITLKLLYGRITDDNNPDLHPELFKFPEEEDGTPLSHSLEIKPYIEASVGVANIFKIIRIDLIKRFTYLDLPNVSQYGIRARAKFDF